MISTILDLLRSRPTRIADLDPGLRQQLRDLFQQNQLFNQNQRGLLDDWWLALPIDRVGELAKLNKGRGTQIYPVLAANGDRFIPAALLSDPVNYGHAFDFLSTLVVVENITLPTEL